MEQHWEDFEGQRVDGVPSGEGVFHNLDADPPKFWRGLWNKDGLEKGEIYVAFEQEETDGLPWTMTIFRAYPALPPTFDQLYDSALFHRSYELQKIPISIEYFENKADNIIAIKESHPVRFAREISDLERELNFITTYFLDFEEKFPDIWSESFADEPQFHVHHRQFAQIKMAIDAHNTKESENDPNYG